MFKIHALNPNDMSRRVYYYDPHKPSLTDANGVDVVAPVAGGQDFSAAFATSASAPGRKSTPRVLKISLGLSCNYECEYCSQRFVPRAEETSRRDIRNFVDGLDSWVSRQPQQIEFWGGEPFVYWKTFRPLAETLRVKYPNAQFLVITNGSLLTDEINRWLVRMDFNVGISHDGPGQHVRGPDPLHDAEKREAILSLYKMLRPLNKISFNSMVNRSNASRAAIQKFFVDLTGDENVPIGEGAFVDAYDEGGLANSLRDDEHKAFRLRSLQELRAGSANNFGVVQSKVKGFVDHLANRIPSSAVWQKCGMDRPENIAVDLLGNVLTCQNVSSVGVSPNGQSHKIGQVSELDSVQLKTATHWSRREECGKCPVLHLCKGSCMYLDGDLWETTCNNAYSDNIPIFAAAFELLTGHIPEYIDGPLREDRRNLWEVQSAPKQTKRVIAIAPVHATA